MQSGFIEIIKRDELIIHVLLTSNLCIVEHLKNCRSISSISFGEDGYTSKCLFYCLFKCCLIP